MVKTIAATVLVATALLGFNTATIVSAKERQDLRLYRVNKDGISDRFWFTRGKARNPGCHNIFKKSRLHRAVQYGYPVCYIFSKKNCPLESALTFTREDEDTPQLALSQGYSWFTVSEHKRGERVKSWHCGDPITELEQQQVELNAQNTDEQ